MNEVSCDECQEHSGMESRQTLLLWLTGILIAALITVGGAQITMLMTLREDVAVVQTQLSGMDDRFATEKRMSHVEQDVAVLKIVCSKP